MKAKTLLIIIAVLLAAGPLLAEDAKSKAGFGLHFGTSSGNGYAMRWTGTRHGFQATLGAYTSGSNNPKFTNTIYLDNDAALDSVVQYERDGRSKSFTLGLNYLVMLDTFKSGRLYLMMGGAYTYHDTRVYSMDYRRISNSPYYDNYSMIPNTEKDWIDVDNRWTVGLGPGFDLKLGSRFRLAFEVPLTYNSKDEIVMYIPQVGIYYYFK